MHLNPLKVLPAGKASWYSSISAGYKLDTTPSNTRLTKHTLRKIRLSPVQARLCVPDDRCIGIKIEPAELSSVHFRCHAI